MPNHITNRITIEPKEKAQEVFDFMKNEEGHFDFNKIYPMPEYIYHGSIGRLEEEIFGSNTWYDWSTENWGTKWNAYAQDEENIKSQNTENSIHFQTAWSCVPRIILLLASKFDDRDFTYEYADEDFGYNCGRYEIKGSGYGRRVDRYIPDGGTKEAFELAASLHPHYIKDYRYYWDEKKQKIVYGDDDVDGE